ncbi:hypothetical protein [Nocardioides sp.]|jgi:hypothetical protein|uniref:hypothetical protein n=1 Tax=Nocardioides sp. TaxID=35761 RepID=UPI002F3FA407
MPIRIVAKGRVTGGPSRLLGDESCVVFVLDPFPDSLGARLAHACEVVCRSQDLASTALETVQWGDLVEVTGELVMETVMGPIEDDLSAVRAWIEATTVALTHDVRAF